MTSKRPSSSRVSLTTISSGRPTSTIRVSGRPSSSISSPARCWMGPSATSSRATQGTCSRARAWPLAGMSTTTWS